MGRWSKFHDQRKGQWLINYIRFVMDCRGNDEGKILFNMSNKKFDELMSEYYTQGKPSGMPSQERVTEMSMIELKKHFSNETAKIISDMNKEIVKED